MSSILTNLEKYRKIKKINWNASEISNTLKFVYKLTKFELTTAKWHRWNTLKTAFGWLLGLSR